MGLFEFYNITFIDLTRTVEEVFTGKRVDIQDKKMLPIFSFVLVYFPDGKDEHNNKGTKVGGLYVGPALYCDGGIRVAIIDNRKIQVVTTVKYSTPSTGATRFLQDVLDGIDIVTEPVEQHETVTEDYEINLITEHDRRYSNDTLRTPERRNESVTED